MSFINRDKEQAYFDSAKQMCQHKVKKERCATCLTERIAQLERDLETARGLLPKVHHDEDGALWFEVKNAAFNCASMGPITRKRFEEYAEALSTWVTCRSRRKN